MAAIRTEFGLFWNGMLAIRTFISFLGLRGLEKIGKHGRHHQTETCTETCACLCLRFRRLLYSHRSLHLQKAVEVIKNLQSALIVDGLLNLRGWSNGHNIKII